MHFSHTTQRHTKMISTHRISKYIYLVILNCMLLFAGDPSTLSVYTYNQDQSPLEGASIYIKNNKTMESRGASSDKMGNTYFNEVIYIKLCKRVFHGKSFI